MIPMPQAPQAPPTEAERASAQKYAKQAIESLEKGEETQAKELLAEALKLDPDSELANKLLKQIKDDPAVLWGNESFKHTVRANETLSKVAQHYFRDKYQFYSLARYNGIRVPRNLHVGQTIRIPRKLAAESAPIRSTQTSPMVPAESRSDGQRYHQEGMQALQRGEKEKAYDWFKQAIKVDPALADAQRQADVLRSELIAQHYRLASTALERHDLETCIGESDKVLLLDARNERAQLKRQQCVNLHDNYQRRKRQS